MKNYEKKNSGIKVLKLTLVLSPSFPVESMFKINIEDNFLTFELFYCILIQTI